MHDITFQWPPGHFGIDGNQHADNSARNAYESGVKEAIPLSRIDAASKIRSLARDVMHSMWNTSGFLHTRLHRLDPSFQLQVPLGLSRSETTVLGRLWLDVSFTNSFAHRIGIADSAACDHCGSEESIAHVLCYSPHYSSQ
uniref:Tick transposon n=1 Tax=Rhipicephalus zambeziensis TaxID=60191 RepID=A0A224ZAD3_9ACAR